MLKLKNVIEIDLKKFSEELDGIVDIWLNLPMIDFKWESLLLDRVEMASVRYEDRMLLLETTGQIEIIDTETGDFFMYPHEFPDDLIELIDNGNIWNVPDKYNIRNNNWFCLTFMEVKENGYHNIDDYVYEGAIAENVDELILDLERLLKDFINWEE